MNLGSVGMVACNFNKDAKIDDTDANVYKKSSGKRSTATGYNAACDFNHDGSVDVTDANIYKAFSGRTLTNAIYG